MSIVLDTNHAEGLVLSQKEKNSRGRVMNISLDATAATATLWLAKEVGIITSELETWKLEEGGSPL